MLDPLAERGAPPCPECPAQRLREFLDSPLGLLISAVVDLDFALQAKMSVSLSQVSFPEFLLLRQLVEERDRHQVEQIRKKQ
jgi:hypothetical protein